MSRRKTTWRVGVLAGVLWAAAIAGGYRAQGTGGLHVTVLDAAGKPLPGREVVLRHGAARLEPQERTTDAAGTVEFPVLAAEGDWVVRVALDDVHAIERNVTIVLGGVTRILVRLDDDPETAAVEAPGGSPDVETTAGITRFPEDFVRELPIPGRFYQRVLPLAPGVNDLADDGNPRVHGSTSRDFRAIVNGISNVDPVTDRFMSFVNSESIDQIAVIPTGAGLEFGRAQGGFAAITQKIGGNRFAIGAELRYRSSDLDGSEPDTDGSGDVEFRSAQPSAIVSGPIVKDKLWFRLAWERVDEELPIDVLRGIEIQTREQTIQAYQLTWQASSRHRLALQYQSDRLDLHGFGIDSSVPIDSSQRIDSESKTLSLVWTVPWSSRLLVETTVAVQDRAADLLPERTGVANDCAADPVFGESFCTTQSNRTSGTYYRSVETNTDRLMVASRGTWHVGRLAGVANQLRFGIEIENDTLDRTLGRGIRSELFDVLWTSTPLFPTEPAEVDGVNWGLYVQDRIRPLRNLVLELGLRVDREEIDLAGFSPFDPAAEAADFRSRLEAGESFPARQSFTAYDRIQELGFLGPSIPVILRQSAFWNHRRVPASIDIVNTNVSPAFAVSWDPWKDGRNKFAASARRYYGSLLLATPLLEQEQATASLSFDTYGPSNFDQLTIDTTTVDHSLDTPYQDEWRLVYERELWRENRLHVEYVNRKYRDQLQVDDINRRTGDSGRCFLAANVTDPYIVASPGAGFELIDPYTGEAYVDTDAGNGDGRLDDCYGVFEQVVVPDPYDENGVRVETLPRADGRDDRYIQNPGWGSVMRITNDGKRDYEAIVVEFVRRQSRGWSMQASYVWSMFEGSAESFEPYLGADRSQLENRAGAESTDQRHVVKVATNGVLRGDWRLAGVLKWHSGLPYSRVENALEWSTVPPEYLAGTRGSVRPRATYRTGERNSERNDARWVVDFRVAKGFTLDERARLELALDVFNLLNDRTIHVYNPDTRIGLEVNGIASGRRDFGRSYQLGLRFTY